MRLRRVLQEDLTSPSTRQVQHVPARHRRNKDHLSSKKTTRCQAKPALHRQQSYCQHHRLGAWCGGLGDGPYFAALHKSNGRVNDNLIALFNPIVHFYLRT
jgi:hypothetical protein